MNLQICPYTALKHFALVRDFIHQRTRLRRGHDGWDVVRWDTQFSPARMQRQPRIPQLFFHQQQLVGVLLWEGEEDAHLLVELAHQSLLEHMFNHALQQHGRSFWLWVERSDSVQQAVLMAAGFRPNGDVCQDLSLHLAEEPVSPLCPEGYQLAIPDLNVVDTRQQLSNLENAVFPWANCNQQIIAEYQQMPSYPDAQHLTLLDAHGQIAAMCILWLDLSLQMASFEPVGTHPKHQRKGLAAYLLREAVRRGFNAGARQFSVGAYNDAASALYRSVGLEELHLSDKWCASSA